MQQPKFRLFAGPNGSGKTTFYENLRNANIIHTEIYVNADRIETAVKKNQQFNFNPYRVKVSEEEFKKHILNSGLFKEKFNDENLLKTIQVQSGILHISSSKINSYHASFISTYLVEKLFESKQSFCYETVLSHPDKLKYFDTAKSLNYKTYSYFLYTNNPQINIQRIKARVKQGKHFVEPSLVESRFTRTLNNLKRLIEKSSSIFIIDNSLFEPKVVFQKINGKIILNESRNNFINDYITK